MLVFSSIILIITLIGFTLPQEVVVEKKAEISSTDEKLFDIFTDFKTWEKWSPWADTSNRYTFFGEKSQVRSGFSWKSEQYGSGKLEIVHLTPFNRIDMELSLVEGNPSKFYVELKPEQNKTIVSWGVKTNLGFNPFARYFGFMFKKFVSQDLEKGLVNLEKHVKNS